MEFCVMGEWGVGSYYPDNNFAFLGRKKGDPFQDHLFSKIWLVALVMYF